MSRWLHKDKLTNSFVYFVFCQIFSSVQLKTDRNYGKERGDDTRHRAAGWNRIDRSPLPPNS